jgi:hypothetical protein
MKEKNNGCRKRFAHTEERNTSCEHKLCYEIGFAVLRRRGLLGSQKRGREKGLANVAKPGLYLGSVG